MFSLSKYVLRKAIPKILSERTNVFYSRHAPCFMSVMTEAESNKENHSFNVTNITKKCNSDIVELAVKRKDLHCHDERSVLDHFNADEISDIAPFFSPTFNFSAYLNKSPTLQELVKLGVNLHKIEKRKGIPEYILKLDFDHDMKKHIRFLHDLRIPANDLGEFLTKNPLIFKEDLNDLAVRINYLQSKKFCNNAITRIISKNPYWLMFSTQRIDHRLGHFQTCFNLTGSEVRKLATKQPRLITFSMAHVKVNTFVVKEELGFNDDEMKVLLLEKPRLWMINQVNLKERFEYVHKKMEISHEQIMKHPEVLCSRIFRIRQRHQYLEALGRAQYNPKVEGYVPLDKLVAGTDVEFCQNIAKSSVSTFNTFLKAL